MSSPQFSVNSHIEAAVEVFHAFDHLFTEDTLACEELLKRREDKELMQDVHASLGENSQALLQRVQKPTAILFRQIATPSHETLRFIDYAHRLNLEPLILEYSGDKFVGAGNPYKRALGKIPLFQHTGSDGRDMVKYVTIINFNAFMGRQLSEVCCISGHTLIDFHHGLLEKMTERSAGALCFDATDCFNSWGGTASRYYKPFFSLLIRDCILFENYELTKHLSPFMRDVVIPAFESVETHFGYRPLIVRLLPKHEEERLYWNAYPKHMEPFLMI